MTIAAADFIESTADLRRQVDAALAEQIQALPVGCPAALREAMAYSLLAPGKRLRPLMVLLAAEACGGTTAAAMPAACAVEMVHCYSLIHDDLPAMDDDDLRRGWPTNHKVYGEALAILAGDALLTQAFEVLARQVQPPQTAAACCAALGRAAGAAHLVGGQADDILAERATADPGPPTVTADAVAQLESIHARKTGAMFRVSLQLGGLTAQGSPEQLAALEAYGRCLGLAFQISDDLLDVRGDQAILGKGVHKDSKRGKLTFPGLLGAQASAARAEELVREACHAVAVLLPRAQRLVALGRYVVERDR